MVSNLLYVNVSSQIRNTNAVDITSNNLANSNNDGYKSESSSFSEEISNKNKNISYGINNGSYVNNDLGSHRYTGNNLDIALNHKNTFLVINDINGIKYTRNGKMQIDKNGTLVSATTLMPVLDENMSEINIDITKGKITISNNGEILQVEEDTQSEDNVIAKIAIVESKIDSKMFKINNNILSSNDTLETSELFDTINSGYVEESNVSPILESKKILDHSRELEISNTLVQQSKSINDLIIKNIISYPK